MNGPWRVRSRPYVVAAWLAMFWLADWPARAEAGRVVINEIMYHPPNDREELQWVELLNAGPEPMDLQGWSFKKGIQFTVTNSTVLPPGGFLVICRDRGGFVARYGSQIRSLGDFGGRLSHGGETLQLVNREGRVVDTASYDDGPPWPGSPDGLSASLERIVAAGSGELPANWAPSPLPETEGAAGTPGAPNASARTNLPPVIGEATFESPVPDQPIEVALSVQDADAVREVRLEYQVLSETDVFQRSATPARAWQSASMARTSGSDQNGRYAGRLPPVPAGRLLRFRAVAVDGAGMTRVHPHPDDVRPTWSTWIGSNPNDSRIPWVQLWEFGPPESMGPSLRTQFGGGPRGRRGRTPPAEPARGDAAMIVFPAGGGSVQTFDHIRVTPRQGGWKVRLAKDRLLDQMSTLNVLFEFRPRYVLSEHLSYEVYRAAGVAAPLSGHWRVWHNGRPLGYHLYVEQPNTSFLRRNRLDPDGDLYKLLWYGDGIVGQHEKKNNPETGHGRLVEAIEGLRESRGEAQWDFIQRHFELEAFASYYAVNMCIQNWDGFFNNYFLYRAPGEQGKWVILPWDEDKTWGDYDGASPQYDWTTMPLTFGMSGDRPGGGGLAGRFGGGGPFGGAPWWRPGGWIGEPLLANPQFRERFRARLQELCETVFTPERIGVLIDRLQEQLEPEVRYRAQTIGSRRNQEIEIHYGVPTDASEVPADRVETALAQFRRHLDSFRLQAEKRRAFLLKELARERR